MSVALMLVFCVAAYSPLRARVAKGLTDWRGERAGQTVCGFLNLPVSAHQLARNAIAMQGALDATDVPVSPATTAFFSNHNFAATHIEWLMGLRKEYAGACFPVLDVGSFGLYSQVFTLGRLEHARDIDEQPVNSTRSIEYAVGGSYARQFIAGKLGVGIALSYVESRLAREAARGLSATVDVAYRPLLWLSCDVYARNAGLAMRYRDVEEQLPVTVGAACHISPFLSPDTAGSRKVTVLTGIGVQKSIDEPVRIGVGADLGIARQVFVRAGYEYTHTHAIDAEGLSAGIGLQINGYGVDAGWKYQSKLFGSVWSVTLKMATEELKARTALDYYKIARKHFNKSRYRLAIVYAKRALRLNPNLWQAHQLISETVSTIRRRKGSELALIYAGNIRGQVLPRPADQTSIGGIARQATAIARLKKQYPLQVTCWTGNFMSAGAHPLKARLAGQFLRRVKFDAAGIGDREAAFGISRFVKAADAGHTMLSTNVNRNLAGLIDSKVIRRGPYRFAIMNVTAPPQQTHDSLLIPWLKPLAKKLASPEIAQSSLRIVMFHDSWKAITAALPQLPGVDIALCGALSEKFTTPMRIGKAICLSTGASGAYTGVLTLRYNDKRELVSFNNKLIALTDQVPPDTGVAADTRAITARIERMAQGLAQTDLEQAKADGVFAFVSDRNGLPAVYLKVPDKLAEFPLTSGTSYARQPRICFATDKIVYLEKRENDRRVRLKTMDITGAHKWEMNIDRSVREAAYGPGGRWLYAAVEESTGADTDLFRIRSAGGELIPLITWPGSAERTIVIGADGASLLFTSDRDGRRHIYLTDTSGAEPVRITDANADHVRPAISPAGRFIAYLSDKFSFGDTKDLWIHDLHTGDNARITANINVRDICWIDNRWLVYSSGVNLTDCNLYDMASGKTRKFIRGAAPKDYSETRPRLLKREKEMRIIYCREYLDGEKQIYSARTDGSDDTRIVNSPGNDWLE